MIRWPSIVMDVMVIKVTAVKAMNNYLLEFSFNTGETRIFDVDPYLDKGSFTELRDPAYISDPIASLSGTLPGQTNRILVPHRCTLSRASWRTGWRRFERIAYGRRRLSRQFPGAPRLGV